MEITEVKVFPIGEEKLKAFVSVVFDHCFMVNDIKIIQGRDGLFISMPSRKKKNGEFKDVAHPLNNETRRRIEGRVLGEYERVLAERGEELPAPPRTAPSPGPQRLGRQDGETGPIPIAAAPPPAAADGAVDGAPAVAAAADGDRPGPEPSLEEVQELHLRDSFWSVS